MIPPCFKSCQARLAACVWVDERFLAQLAKNPYSELFSGGMLQKMIPQMTEQTGGMQTVAMKTFPTFAGTILLASDRRTCLAERVTQPQGSSSEGEPTPVSWSGN
mmetsp:Transcript_3147/g.5969  ORF Transcript_3147/g.5969 Transcript_3147/m.5969 type:complete len:105 (-) Transcript_3147:441-755(-)